jgi:Carboxypeptidase regulatory-like domain
MESLNRVRHASLAVALVILGLAIFCSDAKSQSGAGSIQGTVTDQTGAVIPGATIHVVNNATGVAANAKTNAVGFYQVPGLFTGSYTLTISAPNMKSYRAGVQLQVAQAAVINPVMSTGPVTQQVEVSSDIVQLTTTDNGTIASTLESNRINQLPMNGRLLLTLAGETTPGLESTGQRANGLMPEALEYVADGVPLSNRNFGGEGNSTQAQLPDPDAVQEVRIETTNTSAMYSAPATGIITTKSGTNSLHGSFFETARNDLAPAKRSP